MIVRPHHRRPMRFKASYIGDRRHRPPREMASSSRPHILAFLLFGVAPLEYHAHTSVHDRLLAAAHGPSSRVVGGRAGDDDPRR